MGKRTRMGSWKDVKEEYVVCKNPACRPFADGTLSWRAVSRGPGVCKFCKSDFPIFSESNGWNKQDAKGRTRPSAVSSSPPASQALSEDSVKQWLRSRFEGDDESFQAQFLVMAPPKPKAPGDLLKEAVDKADKAQRVLDHEARKASDMEASFVRQCEALVEYENTLEAQRELVKSNKLRLDEAQKELRDIQSSAGLPAPKPVDPAQLVQSYNPTGQISQALAALPVLQGLDAGGAKSVGDCVANVLKLHLQEYTSRVLSPYLANSATASASAASHPDTPNVFAADSGIESTPPAVLLKQGALTGEAAAAGDAIMTQSSIKRGIDEVLQTDENREMAEAILKTPGANESIAASVTADICNQARLTAQKVTAMHSSNAAESPPAEGSYG